MRSSAFVVLILLASSGAAAQQSPTRTVAGIVTDTARNPIPGVEVGVLAGRAIARALRTGEDGRFEFSSVPDGKVSIVARRLGFQPRVYGVQIREGTARTFVPVVLDPMPTELDKVIVLARVAESGGRLKDFYERKSRNVWGSFIEREQIERRNPTWMSEMLGSIPGVWLLRTRQGQNAVRIRGCRPTLWMDGVPLRHAEIDQVVVPTEIAAVEVYRSPAEMPQQFNDFTGCGAIIVWTRIR